MTPTDYAKMHFKNAEQASTRIFLGNTDEEFKAGLSGSIGGTASGLAEMATAIRATYILLEQVNRKLDQLKR